MKDEERDLNTEKDTQIDPNALDVEWLLQASLMDKYGELCEEAVLEKDNKKLAVDMAKEKLEEVKSLVSLKVRQAPSEYITTEKSVTEDAIKAYITIDEKVMEAKEEYFKAWEEFNEAKHNAGILYNAVKAIEAKKYSLENLIRLLTLQYFNTPTEPRDLGNEFIKEKKRRAANDKIKARKKMKKKNKEE